MAPPFSCSQKLIYCDTNEDLLPDRILKNYRNPALKKEYTCPLRPANGPESLEGVLLAPKNGPLSLASNIPPKEGVSTLSSILKLPTEASGEFDLSTKVDAPAAITDVTAGTVSPIEGVSALSSSLDIPKETSGDFDLSAKVDSPAGITDLSTDINPPVSVSGLTSSLLKPSAVSDLEARFLQHITDLKTSLKEPSAITDLSSSIGVSEPVSDLLSTLKRPDSFSINLAGSIKSPTGITDLSIRRPAGFSMGLSASVVRPSAISDLSIRRPAAFSIGLTAELNKPSLINNLAAELAEPWLGVTNLSSFTSQPHTEPALSFSGASGTDIYTPGIPALTFDKGYFVIPLNVGTAAATWTYHLDGVGYRNVLGGRSRPVRFQILYDTSGSSNLIDDCDIVADSLFVGSNVPSDPVRQSHALSKYLYVGTDGTHFSGRFNQYGGTKNINITDSDVTYNWWEPDFTEFAGTRKSNSPTAPGQIGVQATPLYTVYRGGNELTLESPINVGALDYDDERIALTFTKPVSTADRAYLAITVPQDDSAAIISAVKQT